MPVKAKSGKSAAAGRRRCFRRRIEESRGRPECGIKRISGNIDRSP
jgi:hypothetical protein